MTALPGKAKFGGYVYVIRFGDETVKVGSTTNPQSRIRTHEQNAESFGHDIGDFWLSPLHDGHAAVEQQLIQIARDLSTGSIRSEWFTGVDFAELVDQAQLLPFPPVDVAAHQARMDQAYQAGKALFGALKPKPMSFEDHVGAFFGRTADDYSAPELMETGASTHEDLADMAVKMAAALKKPLSEVLELDWIDQIEILALTTVRVEATRLRLWAINNDHERLLRKYRDLTPDACPCTDERGVSRPHLPIVAPRRLRAVPAA